MTVANTTVPKSKQHLPPTRAAHHSTKLDLALSEYKARRVISDLPRGLLDFRIRGSRLYSTKAEPSDWRLANDINKRRHEKPTSARILTTPPLNFAKAHPGLFLDAAAAASSHEDSRDPKKIVDGQGTPQPDQSRHPISPWILSRSEPRRGEKIEITLP